MRVENSPQFDAGKLASLDGHIFRSVDQPPAHSPFEEIIKLCKAHRELMRELDKASRESGAAGAARVRQSQDQSAASGSAGFSAPKPEIRNSNDELEGGKRWNGSNEK